MDKNIIIDEREDAIAFEFVKLKTINDFKNLTEILVKNIRAEMISSVEGPYSNDNFFKKNGIEFSLQFDELYGNSLIILGKNNKNINFIKNIANEIYIIYNEKY